MGAGRDHARMDAVLAATVSSIRGVTADQVILQFPLRRSLRIDRLCNPANVLAKANSEGVEIS
jgi:hypothetical protein